VSIAFSAAHWLQVPRAAALSPPAGHCTWVARGPGLLSGLDVGVFFTMSRSRPRIFAAGLLESCVWVVWLSAATIVSGLGALSTAGLPETTGFGANLELVAAPL